MRRLKPHEWTAVAVAALLVALVAASVRSAQQQEPKKAPPSIAPLAELKTIAGTRLSPGATYDNQPAVAETADGTSWIAHVRYHNRKADEIVVFPAGGEPQVLSPEPGQYVRPALAASGNDLWCVWTATEPDRVSSIWHSRRTGGAWSKAARLVPEETRAHQNPEIAAAPDGRAAVAYQVHTGAGYDIQACRWDGKSWSASRTVNDAASNNWDPAVAIDAQGRIHVAWCAFHDGDYDVMWARLDGAAPRRISNRGEYDLHPWLSPAPDGTVWASWDVIRIPRHGNSGQTTITGANRRYEQPTGGHMGGVTLSAIEVRALDGDAVRVPGRPREEIVAPQGYLIAHCAYGKVAVGRGGEPWIFYRVLRRAANSPGIGYYWDLVGRAFRGGSWSEAVRFADADGYLEEPGLAAGANGIVVAYGSEHRHQHIPKGPAPAAAEPHDHHRDFDSRLGWNGEVYLARVVEQAANRAALPEAKAMNDTPVTGRPRAERYQAGPYRLLWGDTHRHSNVSRCSQGGEPTPDDLYRYGADICRYDFFALSDHAEDPRRSQYDVIDYYWWKQQKLADLYHVPGAMSVLYNFEWSLQYPHGHHNTIFPRRPTYRLDRSIAASSTLAGGWKILEREGLRAITIPHTGADPGMGTAWEVQDDRYQRLCEIFQACRGSYEHAGCPREFTNTRNKKGYYWNALEKGYHVGVIASTDHGYGVSYACVYAPANTREAIWQAMWDRRTYGSTTYGLVLDFRSGDHWMGEEWSSKEAPALDVYVRGAQPIRSIEIIGRSKVLYAEGSVEKPLNAAEHRVRWTDPDWAAQTAEQWYYVRVIQVDDEMAWSSPVWVKPVATPR